MDFKTLRTKPKDALKKELESAQTLLKELQFKNSAHQLKQVREMRRVKKLIAQLMTLQSE